MKPSFSVSLIAKDEAKVLPRLMKSLEEFTARGGEVVLVDTGSKDGTPELARKLGCKVFEVGDKFLFTVDEEMAKQINRKFVVIGEEKIIKAGDVFFDYASARNYSSSMATSEYISVVDCDEFFTKLDIDAVEKALADGYEQIEHHFIFSRSPSGFPYVQFTCARFYDRRKCKWVGVVHEFLSGEAKHTYLGPEIIELEHCQDPEAQPRRSRYLAGLAVALFQDIDHDRNSHYFARELLWNGRPKSAIQEFKRHVAMNKWVQERGQSLIFIGDAYQTLGENDKALEYYNKAFVTDGTRREPLMRLAEFFWKRNDYQKVACYASAALEIPLNDCYCNQGQHYTNEPHERLYWALWYLGDKKRAKEHWQKALAYEPTNPKYISEAVFFNEPVKPCEERPALAGRSPKSIETLTHNINYSIPFTFVKCGDGELNCMAGWVGENCDGQPYSSKLGADLCLSYRQFMDLESYVVMWDDQEKFNMLLHRTPNDPQKLKEFYLAIRKHDGPKIFVGPERLADAATLLKAQFFPVPAQDAYSQIDAAWNCLEDEIKPGGIYVFSAGMLSKVLIARAQKQVPDATYIDAGSAFDPLFFGETRTFQIPKAELERVYEDVVNFDKDTVVSFLIPTLGRADGLKRCLTSIERLNWKRTNIEVLIDDDPDATVPVKVNRMAGSCKGDVMVFAANDVEFTPDSLRNAVRASHRHGLVAFNTGSPESDPCEHFLIRRDFYYQIGAQIFDERFHHVGCDNLLWARAKAMGEAFLCKDAVLLHHHFSRGGQMDEVYERGWSHADEDRKLLAEELEKLK